MVNVVDGGWDNVPGLCVTMSLTVADERRSRVKPDRDKEPLARLDNPWRNEHSVTPAPRPVRTVPHRWGVARPQAWHLAS
jgi:hypothetical protein